uniref:Uncharacterized protein n=1 Tax=Colobus angolensis palliatus TaxID=336983 RepID=A0A2K5HN43_COLAP
PAPTSVCTEKSPRWMSAQPVLAIWGGGEEAQQNMP